MSKDTLKNIILFVLFAAAVAFFIMWYSKPTSVGDANKLLQARIDSIQTERDKLLADIKVREGQAAILEDSIRKGEAHIAALDESLKKTKANLDLANKNVQVASDYYKMMLRKLANLQSHPFERNGDSLLNNLKAKLK
jgi:septal ring factor EnvC (AmiA/AmiB activator)